jgi:hypothetical protein
MPENQVFDYLPLLRRSDGAARYQQPRFQDSQQTQDNRINRSGHSAHLGGQVATVTGNWQSQQTARVQDGLPSIGDGIPLLLQIDDMLDIDDLRNFFGFEIISEEDDGFVIVASEDKTLGFFQEKLRDFVESIDGSAGIAKIHELSQDLTQEERLKRILSDRLFLELPQLDTDTEYIVDAREIGFCPSCESEDVSLIELGQRLKQSGLKQEISHIRNGTNSKTSV